MHSVLTRYRFSSIAFLLASVASFSITLAATPQVAAPQSAPPSMTAKPSSPAVSPNAINRSAVVSTAAKLVGAETIAAVGTVAHLKANVSGADQLPVANTSVVFSHNGRDLGTATSGVDGIAVWDYAVPDTMPIGSNTVNLRLANQPAIQANLTLAVVKSATYVAEPKIQFSPLDPNGYTAKVTAYLLPGTTQTTQFTAYKNVLKDRIILIKFGGQTTQVKTLGLDTFGGSLQITPTITETFQVKPTDFGKTIDVSVSFEGDAHYLASSYAFPAATLPKPPAPLPSAPDFSYSVHGPINSTYGAITVFPGDSADIDVTLRWYTDSTSGLGELKGPVHFILRAKPAVGSTGTAFVLGQGVTDANLKGKIHYSYPLASSLPSNSYELEVGLVWAGGQTFPPSFNAQQISTRDPFKIMAPQTTMQVKAPASANINETIAVDVYTTRKSDGKPVGYAVRVTHHGGQSWQVDPDTIGHAVIKIPMSGIGLGRQEFRVATEIPQGAMAGIAESKFAVNVVTMPLQSAPQSPLNK